MYIELYFLFHFSSKYSMYIHTHIHVYMYDSGFVRLTIQDQFLLYADMHLRANVKY